MTRRREGPRQGRSRIQILGRDFRVACPEGEEKQLLASVEFVNRRMKELRDTGKVTGNERIAIMAALNIAHEFLAYKAVEGRRLALTVRTFGVESPRCRRRWIRRSPPTRTSSSSGDDAADRPAGFPAVFVRAYIFEPIIC